MTPVAITAQILWQLLKHAVVWLLWSLLTRDFVVDMIVIKLRWLAERTDNTLDNQIVDAVEKALRSAQEKEKKGLQVVPKP